MLLLNLRRWTLHMCQMMIAITASSASPPCAALAAGMNWPGKKRAVAIGFHIMKPVRIMTTVPQTSDQYSTFSSKV